MSLAPGWLWCAAEEVENTYGGGKPIGSGGKIL